MVALARTPTRSAWPDYTFDAWNRATSIRGIGFAYDALGRRVWETANGGREFFHSGWQVIETRTGAMSRAHEQFVYSLAYIDAVVLRDRDSDNNTGTGSLGITGSGLDERLYFQQDREFNVTALLDTSGAVVERAVYDPYGDRQLLKPDWTLQNSSTYANNVGFTGRWHDVTGCVYMRGRYLESVLGRFTTRGRHCRNFKIAS